MLAAGSGLDLVLLATIYLVDVADWAVVDRSFAERFGPHTPARGMVPVTALHLGARVGMQVTAALR